MNRILFLVGMSLVFACSEKPAGNHGLTEEEALASAIAETIISFDGNWNATWITSPASFENVPDVTSFEMNGYFLFQGDSVTITANGFEGCIFGIDTITHSQKWLVSNDSLHLIGENGIRGISYKITDKTSSSLNLLLMNDIFLKLKK